MPSALQSPTHRTSLSDDPFASVLRPPPGETPAQKADRLKAEAEAKRISEEIDKKLKEEAARWKKERSSEFKMLLLGQAAAGKTTILKQMRLLYNPAAHDRERYSWRALVQLNVIMAVRCLVEALDAYEEEERGQSSPTLPIDRELTTSSLRRAASPVDPAAPASPQRQSGQAPAAAAASSGNKALFARLRFAPLLSLEPGLRRRLGAAGDEVDLSDDAFGGPSAGWARSGASTPGDKATKGSTLLLRAGWQDRLLSKLGKSSEDQGSDMGSLYRGDSPSASGNEDSESPTNAGGGGSGGGGGGGGLRIPSLGRRKSSSALASRKPSSAGGGSANVPPMPSGAAAMAAAHGTSESASSPTSRDRSKSYSHAHDRWGETPLSREEDPARMLSATKGDIHDLWKDPLVRMLRKRGSLDHMDSAVYFLDNIDRIADPDYFPTDDDILHARVRTVGITEERFVVDKNITYRICDVGGSRNQRTFWVPYFDDAQAIIFLAPISAFDQTLVEDPSVNRINDSLELFSQIVSNPLLNSVSLVLFLNKIDILDKKLRAGIQVKDYFPDYDGPNEQDYVWRYFRSRFRAVVSSRRSAAPQRPIYVHTTVATSTKQIKAILISVNDTILRNNLRNTGLTYDM